MSITFYHSPMSSALPVASVLNELGVPHERVVVDLKSGDQKKPAFLAHNPNGKVPTLVVDGTPMFEAAAIMQWLGDRYGVDKQLWPAFDDPARLTAVSWSTWTYVTLGNAIMRMVMTSAPQGPAALQHAGISAHAREEVMQLLGMLEQRLSAEPHMLKGGFGIVDIITGSMVLWGTYCGISVDALPAVKRWLDEVKQRPSVKTEWT